MRRPSLSLSRPRLAAVRTSVSSAVRSCFRALALAFFLLLRELRDLAYTILLVSVGAGLVAYDLRPGIAWGVGMLVFGGLSLILRWRQGGDSDGG